MSVTIFMPVSRDNYLDVIFGRLELLDCVREKTDLFVVVDGDEELYVKTRNFVEKSKFEHRLCIQYGNDRKHKKTYDLLGRRIRIAEIHNFAKTYINACDYVFEVEDDTVVPTHALRKLKKMYVEYPNAGLVSGVQIARWGIPHVGAWKVDDVYEPKHIESVPLRQTGIGDVDAAGFYCYLTKRENFVNHRFDTFEGKRNTLGPDFNFGLTMRQEGFLNYIDWTVQTIHKSHNKDLSPATLEEPRIASFRKGENTWTATNFRQPASS